MNYSDAYKQSVTLLKELCNDAQSNLYSVGLQAVQTCIDKRTHGHILFATSSEYAAFISGRTRKGSRATNPLLNSAVQLELESAKYKLPPLRGTVFSNLIKELESEKTAKNERDSNIHSKMEAELSADTVEASFNEVEEVKHSETKGENKDINTTAFVDESTCRDSQKSDASNNDSIAGDDHNHGRSETLVPSQTFDSPDSLDECTEISQSGSDIEKELPSLLPSKSNRYPMSASTRRLLQPRRERGNASAIVEVDDTKDEDDGTVRHRDILISSGTKRMIPLETAQQPSSHKFARRSLLE